MDCSSKVHEYVQYVGNIETNSHEFSVSPVLKLPNVFFFFFFFVLVPFLLFCILLFEKRPASQCFLAGSDDITAEAFFHRGALVSV